MSSKLYLVERYEVYDETNCEVKDNEILKDLKDFNLIMKTVAEDMTTYDDLMLWCTAQNITCNYDSFQKLKVSYALKNYQRTKFLINMHWHEHYIWRDDLFDYIQDFCMKSPKNAVLNWCTICKNQKGCDFSRYSKMYVTGEERAEFLTNVGWKTKFENEKILPSANAIDRYVVNYFDPITGYNHYAMLWAIDTSSLTDDFIKYSIDTKLSLCRTPIELYRQCVLTMMKYHYEEMTFHQIKNKHYLMKGYNYEDNDKLFNSFGLAFQILKHEA